MLLWGRAGTARGNQAHRDIIPNGVQTSLNTPASLSVLKQIQEEGGLANPIDHYTDCRDLFQLVVGESGVPQDR